jgi:hypothetical protein
MYVRRNQPCSPPLLRKAVMTIAAAELLMIASAHVAIQGGKTRRRALVTSLDLSRLLISAVSAVVQSVPLRSMAKALQI